MNDDIKRPKNIPRARPIHMERRPIDTRAPVIIRSPQESLVPPQKSSRKIALKLRVPPRATSIIRLVRGFFPSRRKHPIIARVGWGALAFLMFATIMVDWSMLWRNESRYKLSPKAQTLLSPASASYATRLAFNSKTGNFNYNADYTPAQEVATGAATPKFTATFSGQPEKGITIVDPATETSIGFTPEYKTDAPRQDQNRLVYPMKGRNATKVYSLKSIGMKEDIILNAYQGASAHFAYKLELSEGTEARLESNGSLAIYGVQKELLGNISTGSEKDAALLQKARESGKKNTLLFTFPPPFVREFSKRVSDATAWYELKDDVLTLHASGLDRATYPLSIDPTVYIETAAKLMRGNNETNMDFDLDDELIQKSQTTGARIDAWEDNLDSNEGVWDHATAAAGGYVYRVGGRTATAKPSIVGQQSSTQATNGTFTMNMPATRPAGDLYVALMCHDGTGAPTAPGGWTAVSGTDTDELAAYYKIGTDQGGGNEAASYNWTGITEEWTGVIIRVDNFNSSDIFAGTPGTANTTGAATFPATTPDANSTLIIRAVGVNDDQPSTNSWVPGGHTKIYSGNSSAGGTDSCGFAAASLDVPPASGVSTGSTALADSTLNDTYGGISFAINAVSVTPTTQSTVYWAKFNSSTLAIESPNPGTGACTDWCTNSAYNLPEARRGFSLVAYNGYLYAMGGIDGSGNRESTVFIAKLGANGEPSLWHPSGGTAAYWYTDTGLNGSTARSYMSAVAYNNRMYILGGATNAATTGTTTMEYAAINPMGTLGTWTSGTALPSNRYMHSAQMYNDVLYLVGGDSGGTLQNTVYYNRLNSDGSMNAWTQTSSFTTARSTWGGSFTAIWGAYLYIGGGCSGTTGASNYYCSAMATDMQIASINADGTITEWASLGIQNQRVGYSFIAWQNGLYRLGGCVQQNTSTGECTTSLTDVDFGVINPAGEVSTVNLSAASGVAPCSGVTPHSCDLPPPGDDAGEGGQMLSMSAVLNGYLYVIGGCIAFDCDGLDAGTGDDTSLTGNVAYVAIDAAGRLTAPGSCAGTSYGAWCVDATNRINTTTGVAAAGVTVFNNRIYIVGGLDTTADGSTEIYYNSTNTNGSLAGAWSNTTFAAAGITGEIAYTYAYARANPSAAGTNPGNLYVFGGCGDVGTGAGCSSSSYRTQVYKCNITTTGSVSGCTTTGQLQLDVELADETDQGLGIHSGTVYANYVYMIGGFSANVSDRDTVFYARINNSNNVVSASTGAAGGNNDDWIQSASTLSVGRRRGFSFGYNGHIYAVGGYDDSGTGIIPFIEWSKMNVSTGDTDPFQTSTVTINQRWGLSMIVSNSYAYVIGGCDVGISPGGCSSFERSVQTFQLYNNESGAVNNYTAQSDQTFAADTDRIGAASTVYNGYLYVAGGCTNIGCTTVTDNVQFAPLSASDGTVGAWASTTDSTLPAARAWGRLEVAGGTLYYIGGQTATATDERPEIYYGTPSAGNVAAWNTVNASFDLPDGRTRHGSAVWDNRLYVVGGVAATGGAVSSVVYVSPQLNTGGDIPSAWTTSTAFNVAREGTAVTAYANNLYLFGGFDGTNYLSDTQFASLGYKTGTISQSGTTVTGSGTAWTSAQIGRTLQYNDGSTAVITAVASGTSLTVNASKTVTAGSIYTILDGSVGSWTYSTSLPGPLRDAQAVSANGYIYVLGGRSAATTCPANTLITPISANTTIATGNNPTGIGEWYETNVRYTGDRYGAAVAYDKGRVYTMGGGCSALLAADRHYDSTVKSQPQVAKYSRMIDADTDVFPTGWLANGVDNSIGARWQLSYRSMHDISDSPAVNPNEDCGTSATMPTMTTWGQETIFGDVTLGKVETYTPKEASGGSINCARYYYFSLSIDASKTFGYPEDVARGPTLTDLSLFFTSDPNKRLRHGKTFIGGEQQPLDTPCRVSGGGTQNANCPLP